MTHFRKGLENIEFLVVTENHRQLYGFDHPDKKKEISMLLLGLSNVLFCFKVN